MDTGISSLKLEFILIIFDKHDFIKNKDPFKFAKNGAERQK